MLPLIVTVCLSRGARAMASGKAIVRRLDAIETLGGMDVLCVDKTGTLTSGVIKLDRAQSMSGLNSSYVLHAAWLTTLIPHTTSNPWDDAIVAVEGDSANDTGDVQVEEARLSIRYDAGRPSSSRRAITTRTASTQVAAISVRPAAPAPERPGTSAASWSSGRRLEMLPRCDTVMRNGTAEPLTDRRLHPLARPRAHQTVARLDESGTIPSKPRNGCVITSKKRPQPLIYSPRPDIKITHHPNITQ